MDFKELQKK